MTRLSCFEKVDHTGVAVKDRKEHRSVEKERSLNQPSKLSGPVGMRIVFGRGTEMAAGRRELRLLIIEDNPVDDGLDRLGRMSYTKVRSLEPMCPFSEPDRHYTPGLVDDFVPGLAA
jgi:hypothetical protein